VITSGEPATALTEDTLGVTFRPELHTAGRFYRPELDVVRFIAFFLVFLTHTLPSGRGDEFVRLPLRLAVLIYGVQRISDYGLFLFFTLSAFLICELLLRERDATGGIRATNFYIRRLLRIWPLYFAGLTIGLVIAVLRHHGRVTYIWTAWAAVLMGNWFFIFKGNPGNVMNSLWSISVEEQFYLFAPWAVKLMRRRSLCGFAIALLAVAGVWLYVLGSGGAPAEKVWCNSFVDFGFFAAGILLCIGLRGRVTSLHARQRLFLITASSLCWCLAVYKFHCYSEGTLAVNRSWPLICGNGLIALGCCGVILAFLGIEQSFLPQPLIYLGRISYGLYVFHSLAIHFANRLWPPVPGDGLTLCRNAIVSLGMTIVLATLSYRYFESTFLKLKRHYEIIRSRPV